MAKYKSDNSNDDLNKLMFGRVMPQALDLEEVVLGAAMLDKEAFSNISEKLRPESFYFRHISRSIR